ncbi:bifunctional 2-C-methyl-D-erythritol 4-phosphate cytidylyltransferase/2-C-methyl-D-erythritol 2,4-cyclodiphosphate synthase [Phenylobacterium immobile]|uniref:bifunctional 2-C-methyl-D-erythritol 4-phosphate cytidylyltransferase/2-C-methyl-D-erythritol 2,4-cyclodiphosphate synthase n=1 Tax=Phenylobacterium immobile TaxID=21 RepID=UPI000A84F3E5|nr:bifunctional 2-C-methyl-D-erythritol 4-phosphate cytidylyltransferase/2-C-methyl-D-erythritol 2,4-cyclodiphosphate synthase [Phenylobacterium immobile]
MDFSAVIVAAGSGLRAGPGESKTWRRLGGKPVLRWSVEAFAAAGARQIAVVISPDRLEFAPAVLEGLSGWTLVPGGVTRAQSVRSGLAALHLGEAVLIHDAARPFVGAAHIERLIAALANAEGALPALPVADTLKRGDGLVSETVSREGLWRAQTPQAFRRAALDSALASWPAHEEPTDDAVMVERVGGRVVLTPGDPMLMKLTYPEDFAMAERLAGGQRLMRIGQGVDAHRFGPGDSVWLCGVEVAHSQGMIGHSDADCGLHALTDAVLGAIGAADIGAHFPPSDPQWKGAASHQFLSHAMGLVAARGGRVINVDVTLICERPKIGPHREAMRARIAEIMDLPVDRISVKATTTEGMGFTGRQEGLMAQAVVTVETPS